MDNQTPENAPQAPRPQNFAELTKDMKRAGALDLGAVIKASRDTKLQAEKSDVLGLRAEVIVPGIPNGDPTVNGGWGVVCEVRKFTGFEQTQLIWKTRQDPEPDDSKIFGLPKELSSADARSSWWRDIWRLVYGCTDETKVLLGTIVHGKPMRAEDFGPNEAIALLNREDSQEVTEPLLQAINILNYYAKNKVFSSSELDIFKTAPEVLNQLIVAYKGGMLKEFVTGDPEVLAFVVENVGLLMELMEYVDEERARKIALLNRDAVRQAVREVVWELLGNGYELGTVPGAKLFEDLLGKEAAEQMAEDLERLATNPAEVEIKDPGGAPA